MNPDQAKAAVVVEYVMVPRDALDSASDFISRHAESVRMGSVLPNGEWPTSSYGQTDRAYYDKAMAILEALAAPTSPDSSRLGEEGLADDLQRALVKLSRIPNASQYVIEAQHFVQSALTRLSASPGVAGDGLELAVLERRLQGANEAVAANMAAYQRMKQDRDGLAPDALRYRFLRDHAGFGSFYITLQDRREPEEWDAEIDAARGEPR